MGYWGWRPLIFGIFISTWVVGCNMVTDNTLPSMSPSAYPRVTLTVGRMPAARVSAAPPRAAPLALTLEPHPASATVVPYVVLPGDTLAEITRRFAVSMAELRQANDSLTSLTPGQILWIPAPLPQVQTPTCYEIRPDNLLCLGRVDNLLDYPVESITVEVYLLRADGTVYLSQTASVEQTSIPPGSFAAYQASFDASISDVASVGASLMSAQIGGHNFVPMQIEVVDTEQVGERALVNATIVNPSAQAVEVLRAFVTLSDPFGRVTGYRVYNFAPGTILDPAGRLPLQVELTPQIAEAAPEYTVYVEALDASS
jgi:LysM domain